MFLNAMVSFKALAKRFFPHDRRPANLAGIMEKERSLRKTEPGIGAGPLGEALMKPALRA